MSLFITQCPRCKTSFSISLAQLKLAKGKVRCGFCLQIFSALEQQLFFDESDTQDLAKELEIKNFEKSTDEIIQESNNDKAIANKDETLKPNLDNATDEALEGPLEEVDAAQPSIGIYDGLYKEVYTENAKKEELQRLETLYDAEALNSNEQNSVNTLSDEPISIYQHQSRSALFIYALFFSNILLILGILAQYTWVNIDNYLRDSRFTPLTEMICYLTDCLAIERFDLSLFATDELFVNAHSSIPNALQIDFIFRNTAEFEQVFPLVELNFSDPNHRLIANRLFLPEEYLEQGLQQFTHLPPNASIQIHLEISDPGTEALNYSLTLRAP